MVMGAGCGDCGGCGGDGGMSPFIVILFVIHTVVSKRIHPYGSLLLWLKDTSVWVFIHRSFSEFR